MTNPTDAPTPAGPPQLFDIAEVLSGRAYPEVEVPFYMDEATGLALSQANKKLTELAMLGRTEEHDELEKKIEELQTVLAGTRYVYHLRGLPNKVRQDLLLDAYAKYPRENGIETSLGIEQPNEERDNYFSTRLLQAMTTMIEAPNGAVQVSPSVETIQSFRDYAPMAALAAINTGITELTDGVKAGFEAAAQATDFLSQH